MGRQQPATHAFATGQSAVLLQHSFPVVQAPPPSAELQHVWAAVPQCGVLEPVGGGQHFAHVGAQVVWQSPVVVLIYPLQQKAGLELLGTTPSGQHVQRRRAGFLFLMPSLLALFSMEQPEQHFLHEMLLFLLFTQSLLRWMQRLASTSAAGRPIAATPPRAPRAPSTRRRSPMAASRWEMASNRFGSTLVLSVHVTQRRPPRSSGGPLGVEESATRHARAFTARARWLALEKLALTAYWRA